MIIDQGIFSCVIILLILMTYLLREYGYCLEKFDLGHYWDLKGLTTIKIHNLAKPSYSLISFLNEEIDYFIFQLLSYLPHTCRQSILHDHAAGIVQFQDPGQQ